MKIRMDRAVLRSMVGQAVGVVDRKSTLNVLSHVHLETVGRDAVRLTATDYDVGIIAVWPVEVEDAGACCVNGTMLADVAKALPDQPVTIETEPNAWATLTCGGATRRLPGIPPDDFPEVRDPDDGAALLLPRADLLRLVSFTAPAMSDDQSRMNLNGVFLEVTPSPDDPCTVTVGAAATDSHRLHHIERRIALPDPCTKPISAIVHRHGVDELRRLIADSESPTVRVARWQNNIVFGHENSSLVVREIADAFVEYRKAIPRGRNSRATVQRTAVLAATRLVRTATSSKVLPTKIFIDDDRVTLGTTHPDLGDATATLDATVEGAAAKMGLDARYLAAAAEAYAGDTLTLDVLDEFMPLVVRDPDDADAVIVVMGMRI